MQEAGTWSPHKPPNVGTWTKTAPNPSFELDELADQGEHGDENVFCGNGSTIDLVEPYKPVAGFAVAAAPPAVSNQYLKGQKIAYKFQTEWMTGTFRGKYKGKKDEFKSHYAIYFDRKNSFYLELNLSAYGCDQDWVIINKTKWFHEMFLKYIFDIFLSRNTRNP